MVTIRDATSRDRDPIRDVHLRAFPADEGPIVASLAVNLLNEETSPVTISLVAEIDGTVVGHVAFSPVTIDSDPAWIGYILGPLGVLPEFQNRRVGSELSETGLRRLSADGVNVVFVYGDPKYYGKFGFTTAAAAGFAPPYELQFPFGWQAMTLKDGGPESQATINCVASLNDPELW